MRKPVLFLAEDHEVMGLGLRALFEDDFEVYGPHGDGATLVDLVSQVRPSLLVLDLSLPNRNGMYLIEEVLQRSPDTRILVHTMYADFDLMEEARRRGAHGYVGKDSGVQELLRGVTAIRQGETHFSPLIRPPRRRAGGAGPHSAAIARLTRRRQEILGLIGDGLTTDQICRRLGVAERTVYWHRGIIRRELGIQTEEDLAREAAVWRQAMRAAEADTGSP